MYVVYESFFYEKVILFLITYTDFKEWDINCCYYLKVNDLYFVSHTFIFEMINKS